MTDLAKAVGFEYPESPVFWNRRDLLLYAAGIGAKADELQFVYENDPKFAAFPTYPVVLMLKGAEKDVAVFKESPIPVPGLPKFDLKRVVHGSQTIQILKPLPLTSGEGWKMRRKVAGVHENKSGIVVDNEITLVDPSGVPYVQMFTSSFNIGAKASGTKFDKVVASAPTGKLPPKDKKPDSVVTEAIPPEAAIVYRLSGDYNPLHVEPSIGKGAGFGGPILHGLATYGFGARAVLKQVGGNDPTALKYVSARFTSPVKPGDKIETSIWEVGPGPNDTVEVAFQTKDLNSGKIVLGGGTAFVVKKGEKSKL